MKVYASKPRELPLSRVGDYARRVEELGYDGLTVSEGIHDGFLSAHAALAATSRITVATSVVVAFPRSPMIVALAAWDLAEQSSGRFVLGLGAQVRANVVERFSTAWAPPVPRMREYVQSLRSIWSSWQTGAPLRFEGEHYRFTRMQPVFNPGPIAYPDIPVQLGAVAPQMTRLAGEMADGIHTHPSNSDRRTVVEHALPLLAAGAAGAGRSPSACEVLASTPVVSGATDADVAARRDQLRRMLAVMWSTPAYWTPLELRGRDDLGPRLRELARAEKWELLPSLIDDDLLDEIAPARTYDEIAPLLKDTWRDLPVAIHFPLPDDPADDAAVRAVLEELRS